MLQESTSQNLSDENNIENKNSLIHREKIENTPFHIVGTEEEGYFIAMANFKLTEHKKTQTEALEALEKEKWYIMINIMAVVIDYEKGNLE